MTVVVGTSNGPSFLIDDQFAEVILSRKWCWQGDGHSNLKYPRGRVKGKMVRVHRYVYQLAYGPIERRLDVHHVNHDTADNRLENLAAITHGENIHLSKKHAEGRTSSQFRGVYWSHCERWQAATTLRGKHTHIDFFDDEVIASCAVIIARSLYNQP